MLIDPNRLHPALLKALTEGGWSADATRVTDVPQWLASAGHDPAPFALANSLFAALGDSEIRAPSPQYYRPGTPLRITAAQVPKHTAWWQAWSTRLGAQLVPLSESTNGYGVFWCLDSLGRFGLITIAEVFSVHGSLERSLNCMFLGVSAPFLKLPFRSPLMGVDSSLHPGDITPRLCFILNLVPFGSGPRFAQEYLAKQNASHLASLHLWRQLDAHGLALPYRLDKLQAILNATGEVRAPSRVVNDRHPLRYVDFALEPWSDHALRTTVVDDVGESWVVHQRFVRRTSELKIPSELSDFVRWELLETELHASDFRGQPLGWCQYGLRSYAVLIRGECRKLSFHGELLIANEPYLMDPKELMDAAPFAASYQAWIQE